MASQMVLMGSTKDLSGGDVDIVICAGETLVTGNGAPGTGTQWYPPFNGQIVGAASVGETAAATDIRFRKTNDPNWTHPLYLHLQTDAMPVNMISPVNYPVTTGDAIQCQGTGTNTLKTVAFWMSKNNEIAPTQKQPDSLPAGAIWVEATTTVTLVADTYTEGALTFVDFTAVRDRVYKIIGLAADSASGHFAGLRFLEGPDMGTRVGVPCTDTAVALDRCFYGDFGQFKGQTPPIPGAVAEAGDTAVNWRMLIVPVSGGK